MPRPRRSTAPAHPDDVAALAARLPEGLPDGPPHAQRSVVVGSARGLDSTQTLRSTPPLARAAWALLAYASDADRRHVLRHLGGRNPEVLAECSPRELRMLTDVLKSMEATGTVSRGAYERWRADLDAERREQTVPASTLADAFAGWRACGRW